jgi:hypothetical protein
LTPELEEEFRSIVLSLGVREEEWNNRKTTTQTVESMDLAALQDYLESFDFKTGAKVELEWLMNNGVIFGLSDSDIERISEQAEAGLAGHNSRIVWEGGWKPYHETSSPLLLKRISCEGFSAENLPEGSLEYLIMPDESVESQARVVAPIVLGIVVFAILWFVLWRRKS